MAGSVLGVIENVLVPPEPPTFIVTITVWMTLFATSEMLPLQIVPLLSPAALPVTVRVCGVFIVPTGETVSHAGLVPPVQLPWFALAVNEVIVEALTESCCVWLEPAPGFNVRVEVERVSVPPLVELPLTSITTGTVTGVFAAPLAVMVRLAVLIPFGSELGLIATEQLFGVVVPVQVGTTQLALDVTVVPIVAVLSLETSESVVLH